MRQKQIVDVPAIIRSAVKPATRVDGSPLVTDDQWFESPSHYASSYQWRWNGSHWVSPVQFVNSTFAATALANGLALLAPGAIPFHIFLRRFEWSGLLQGIVHDGTNYFTVRLERVDASGTTNETTNVLTLGAVGSRQSASQAINQHRDTISLNTNFFRVAANRIGANTTSVNPLIVTLSYQFAYP